MPADVKILLQKFPSILRTGDVKPTPTHGVKHHIHTGSHPPVFAKSRRLDPEKLQIAKVEFKRLESAGIIRRSTSPWASPLHMVKEASLLFTHTCSFSTLRPNTVRYDTIYRTVQYQYHTVRYHIPYGIFSLLFPHLFSYSDDSGSLLPALSPWILHMERGTQQPPFPLG